MHSSTNYEQIRILIGKNPKIPTECTDIGIDIIQFADLIHEEVDDIVGEMNTENIRKMMEIRQDIFDNAHGNIKRAQKREKNIMTFEMQQSRC